MSDETVNKTGVKVEGEGEDQKIVVGEEELTLDEAKELITSGKSFKELSEEYPDIDFKELPKSFTQTRQELSELKKKPEKKKEENLDEKEVARRNQIKEFFSDPLVKDELKRMTTEDGNALKEDLAFQKTIESLEAEFDGSDGKPKFEKKAVLEYGTKHQIFNPKSAYKDMHDQELEDWAVKKSHEKKGKTTFYEKKGASGAKQPDPKAPKTFREATAAALED